MTHSQRRDDLEVEASLCRLCILPQRQKKDRVGCTVPLLTKTSKAQRLGDQVLVRGALKLATLLTFALTGILPTFQGFCLFVFISPAVDIQHKKIPQIEK